jgi:SCY1-like protein 1
MTSFWKAFGLSGGKELNYDIGEPIEIADDYKYRINWTLHRGTHKVDKTEATIFSFDIKPNSAPEVIEVCRNCVRRARTLMLPSVLKYIDGLETPTGIFMVTEPVRPLHMVLSEMREEGETKFKEFTSWGLYSVIRGLEHLHTGGKVHGNFGMHAIYVNKCGDWKLFGLDWCSPLDTPLVQMHDGKVDVNHFKQYNILIPNELKAPELLKGNIALIESSPIYAVDAWALGLLFFEIFNHQITSSTTPADLKNPGSMPRPIFGAFMGLISHTAKLRMNPAKLVQEGGNDYFNNEYINVQFQLENMALIVKDHLEMETFFRKLERMVDDFPSMNCKYKILPKISEATQFGSGGTAALTTILRLAEQLTPEEYQTLVVPGLLALYQSRDTNVRIKLLQSIPMYIKRVREPEISALWVNLSNGFGSQFAEIRELSIKALVHIVPQLSERLIGTDVMKQLWLMQTDKEGGIRTNAVICLGKIAPMLSHSVREKMLIPSFTRSLKDPFHHSRIACCNSFAATAEFYSDTLLAGQVVPAVAPLCADPMKEVRQAAIKCTQLLLQRLQKMSDGVLDTKGVMESRAPTQNAKESGYLGWAMSSLKTSLYGEEDHPKPVKPAAKPTAAAPKPSAPTAAAAATAVTSVPSHSSAHAESGGDQYEGYQEGYENYDPNAYYEYAEDGTYYDPNYAPAADGEEAAAGAEGSAWNQDLSDFDELESPKPHTKGVPSGGTATSEPAADKDGWGNDEWAEDDDERPPPPPPKPTVPKANPARSPISPASSADSAPLSAKSAEDKDKGMELKKKPVKKSLGAKKLAAD